MSANVTSYLYAQKIFRKDTMAASHSTPQYNCYVCMEKLDEKTVYTCQMDAHNNFLCQKHKHVVAGKDNENATRATVEKSIANIIKDTETDVGEQIAEHLNYVLASGQKSK